MDGDVCQAGRLKCHRRWQATDEQFDSSEVVLHVRIRRVEATHIGFPQQFNRADGSVGWHLPIGEHFVRLVGGEGRQLVGCNGPVGKCQLCIGDHGGGNASIFDGDFNVHVIAGQDVEA